jgi:hypothetical protein
MLGMVEIAFAAIEIAVYPGRVESHLAGSVVVVREDHVPGYTHPLAIDLAGVAAAKIEAREFRELENHALRYRTASKG